MASVLVTGGGGYVGSTLVRKLLQAGHFVRVADLFLYEKDPFREVYPLLKCHLETSQVDIRDQKAHSFLLKGIETVIHLACISNDPSFDLDPKLGRSINLDAFEPFVKSCRDNGVDRFINASSSSVYGVSDKAEVTERSPCNPLTDYSKFKLETEGLLKLYQRYDFTTTSVRSATVCGYSPRQRLDVIVNILTNHAFNKGEITVMGGVQKRPNIHIDDLTDFYVKLVDEETHKIEGEVFNYGGPNYTVEKLAKIVRAQFDKGIKINFKETNDPRSYHISSKKAWKKLGMKPKHTIEDAVKDLIQAFQLGKIPNSLTDSKYFNIERIKELLKPEATSERPLFLS